MQIHPKTSGAAVGAALGVIIVGVLHSISGIHLAPELSAAIPSFLSLVLSWLVPGGSAAAPKPTPSSRQAESSPAVAPAAGGGQPPTTV